MNSTLAREERRHGRRRTPTRTTRRSGGSTRPRRAAPGAGRTCSGSTARPRQIILEPEPALLGTEAGVRAGRDPQHGLRDAVHQRPARAARGRDRPLRPAGAVAAEQPPRAGDDTAVDLGVLAVREQQPGDLGGDVEQALPGGRARRARLSVVRAARGRRGDPGERDHPVDVPRLAAAGDGAPRPRQGEERVRRVGRRRARRSRSSTRAT